MINILSSFIHPVILSHSNIHASCLLLKTAEIKSYILEQWNDIFLLNVVMQIYKDLFYTGPILNHDQLH